MNRPSSTPGICRIDQQAKHNHGFSCGYNDGVKFIPPFSLDFKHGGRAQALAAAQMHHRKLLAKLGLPRQMSRRWWAELRRRKGSSGTVGVQKVVNRRLKHPRTYWVATWSPEPYVVRRNSFRLENMAIEKPGGWPSAPGVLGCGA